MGTESASVRWWLAALFAACAYLFWLDGLYIPHIGDEAPYIEIARLTSESGQWLPLRTGPGLENTKPPLLYWMGIASTRLAGSFTLLALRLPIVAFTLATALLTLVASRVFGYSRPVAVVASITYLGFFSSFQYGRPFLINVPETFFVLLALVLLARGGSDWTYARALGVGAALGTACLFKSFALVGPAGLGLAAVSFLGRDAGLGDWARRDLPRLAVVGAVALACFALWPLADPEPAEVLRHFVLEENLGKLPGADGGYLRGLVSGPYPLYRIWLGSFANAGLFAPFLLVTALSDLRERRRLGRPERQLWLFALAFLVVYSLPSQRQENYLLPIMPVLAILVARRWESLGEGWLRVSAVAGLAVAVSLLYGIARLGAEPGLPEELYAPWQVAIPVAAALGWVAALVRRGAARAGFHALAFLTLWSIGSATAPFEGPAGRFAAERVGRLEGRRVYVPESFIRRHERHRFLLPGARIEPYDPLDTPRLAQLLERGRIVVVHRAVGDHETGPFRVLARRFDLRTRHTAEELLRIVFGGELDLLVRQELVVRRFRPARSRGAPPP